MKLINKKRSNILLIISVVVATAVTAIVSVSSIVNFTKVRNSMVSEFSRQMKSQSNMISDHITHHIKLLQGSTALIASDRNLVELVKNRDFPNLQKKLEGLARRDKYLQNVFIGTAGHNGRLGSKILVDGIGGKAKGVVFGINDIYSSSLKQTLSGKVSHSFVGKSPSSEKSVVLITAPIVHEGKVIAIFGYSTWIGKILNQMVEETKVGKTGYVYFTDMKGVAISYINKSMNWKLNLSKYDFWKDVYGSRDGVTIDYTYKGVRKFVLKKTVPSLGIIVVPNIPYEDIESVIRESIALSVIISVLIGLFAILLVIFVTYRLLNKFLGEDPLVLKNIVDTIANGDLTVQFSKNGRSTGVYADMKKMTENLSDMFKDINSGVNTLTLSSEELSSVSQQMAAGVEQTSSKSHSVASAAEEMATNMTSVAAATEQTATNIQMVVSAAEEMSSTINEIAKNTSKASETTAQSVKKAGYVTEKVDELGKAALEINNVTETISNISEQTNLLALNATIEAARAGDAGKGFAVVANEIKDLAKQTSEATEDISKKIKEVQETTEESVDAMNSIVEIINQTDEIVNSVASAIEEQSATTHEISNNVSHAATGLDEVNTNVNQTTNVTEEVTKDISEVSSANDEMNQGSRQIMERAGELSRLAENLNEMVSRFTVK